MMSEFVIVIDTREQRPLAFTSPTVVATLPTGDYAIQGAEDLFAVERKSIPDLVQSLTFERERFERELVRLAAMRRAFIVVEGDLGSVVEWRYRSTVSPKALVASLASFHARFGIPTLWAGNARNAANRDRILSLEVREAPALVVGGSMIDVQSIRDAEPAPLDLAMRLGLDVARGATRDRVRVLCPWHQEKSASCSITVRDGRLVAHCHSCRGGGDLLALVAAVHRLDIRSDFRRVAQAAAELVGVSIETDAKPTAPRAKLAPVAELAVQIDAAAEAWLLGREVRPDPKIAAAGSRCVIEALRLLDGCDEDDRQTEAEMDARVDAVGDRIGHTRRSTCQ